MTQYYELCPGYVMSVSIICDSPLLSQHRMVQYYELRINWAISKYPTKYAGFVGGGGGGGGGGGLCVLLGGLCVAVG